ASMIPASMIRAEWVKFRTVRGWVMAALIAVAAVAGFAVINGQQGTCGGDSCTQLLGPGGEPVSDSFYFVHQTLSGDGSITARVSALTSQASPTLSGDQRVRVPWAKAGLILKASLAGGSQYAAIMITGSHGVRLQDNFTGDITGPAMPAGWLRLTRSGSVITGYASADGTRWTRVGAVTLPGLGPAVQGGLFTASPQYTQTSMGVAQISGSPSQSTAAFDQVGLTWPSGPWTGTDVGGSSGGPAGGGGSGGSGGAGGNSEAAGPSSGYTRAGGAFTVTGTGDIAPGTSGPSGLGVTITQTLGGAFIALLVLAVIGAMFITAEYRRGLIRVTLAACPRRGRLLAAKACVIGLVAFAAGLAGAAVAVPLGLRTLRNNGVYVAPVTPLTEVRVIVGTAAVLAACAVLAVGIGTIARRGVTAIASVVALIVLPYLLAVTAPVLPLGAADWLMRVTPAAAFAVEQTVIQYPQVDDVYAPAYGYWPLAPWAGFAVLCAWTALALGLGYLMLRRRDA
ncbi:MAG: ABC transporter permease subunit, partial [Streptosporangiaceae bacterium]